MRLSHCYLALDFLIVAWSTVSVAHFHDEFDRFAAAAAAQLNQSMIDDEQTHPLTMSYYCGLCFLVFCVESFP